MNIQYSKVFVNRVVILITLNIYFFQFASAQEDFHYNFDNSAGKTGLGYTGVQAVLNASLVLPTAVFARFISAGINGNIQLKYMVDSKFAIGGYGGFSLLSARTPVIGQTNTLIQYGAVLEYFLFQGSSPYLGFEVGNNVFINNTSGTAVNSSNQNFTYSKSSLGIGPNLGYVIQLNPNMLLNMNLKYSHVFNSLINSYEVPSQFLQLNVGLIFNLSYRTAATDE
ncbi:MAG: hypothetical protein ACKVOU_14880 [Cytophagales bacterium]